MTKKIYKTAQGRTVDLGALMLQNEQVRAVGNMQVNARGDKIDNQGGTVISRNRQASQKYSAQSQDTIDQQAARERAAKEEAQLAEDARRAAEAKAERQARRAAQTASAGGLAGAMDRANKS